PPCVAVHTGTLPFHRRPPSDPYETFTVDLSNPAHATIADGQGLGTITNDDGVPAASIGDVTANEGDSGTTSFDFTVSLTNPSDQAVTVDYATANGTASAPSDYGSTAGTLTFAPGQTSQTVSVAVNGDTTNESAETFTVLLSTPPNATIADDHGLGTITNDDGVPQVSIGDVAAPEGDSGTSSFDFTVSLSNPSDQTITVDYATNDGSATAPSDYTAGTGTVSFAPGQTSQTVSVSVNGDTTHEADETFTVDLSNPANSAIADAQGLGTINNDDGVPQISVS